MITKEMMMKAILEPVCEPGKCIHAEALSECLPQAQAMIERSMANSLISPTLSVFFAGIHVGYAARLAEEAPIDSESVN